jgi:hypothetical protein
MTSHLLGTDLMKTSQPNSLEDKTINLETKSRHLIKCKTKDTYEIARKALSKYDGLKIEMNNYDGTYDFIIECSPEYAETMRKYGLL